MTLEQLRMLIHIAEEGSVFAAAEALHKTQPTVSVSMKKLEKELGFQLLARDQYRATLTTAGAALYERAKMILQQVETFEGLAEYLAVGNEPTLGMAIEASCPMPLMLQIMGICNDNFPKTEFSFSVETIRGASERLMLGESDIAITPFAALLDGVESFRLTSATLIRVASPKFPLCELQQGESQLGESQLSEPPSTGPAEPLSSIDQLKEHVQVIVKDSSKNPPDETLNVLEGGRHWYVNDHYTKKELLVAGMGWGMLHQHIIEDELSQVVLLPLEIRDYPLTQTVEIFVARKAGQLHGPVGNALWAELEALAGRLSFLLE